jgi:hypothetical protein
MTKTRINRQKYTFCNIKSLEHLKLTKLPCPLFGPKTNHTCHQKPNPSLVKHPLRPAAFRPLGELTFLRIWHDNSGPGDYASWFLGAVTGDAEI